MAAEFPGAELREAHGGRLRFQLPPGGRCALARVFGELAVHGAEHGVEDFSVSQTMLEEVITAPGSGWGRQAGGQARGLTVPLVPSGLPTARYSCTSPRTRGRTRTPKSRRRQEWEWTPRQACNTPNASASSSMTLALPRLCSEPPSPAGPRGSPGNGKGKVECLGALDSGWQRGWCPGENKEKAGEKPWW